MAKASELRVAAKEGLLATEEQLEGVKEVMNAVAGTGPYTRAYLVRPNGRTSLPPLVVVGCPDEGEAIRYFHVYHGSAPSAHSVQVLKVPGRDIIVTEDNEDIPTPANNGGTADLPDKPEASIQPLTSVVLPKTLDELGIGGQTITTLASHGVFTPQELVNFYKENDGHLIAKNGIGAATQTDIAKAVAPFID